MTERVTRASLAGLRARKERGEIRQDQDAPERNVLDRGFWDDAEARAGKAETRSVHLRLEKDVFDYFKKAGKGHISRMQDVLKAYVQAHRSTGVRHGGS
jgi:uncharacterized protein (DUF4415 family)